MSQEEEQPPVRATREELLQEAETRVQLYRSLLKLPGWEELARISRQEVEQYERGLFDALSRVNYEVIVTREANGVDRHRYIPLDGQTKALRAEFNKGIRVGILYVLDLPRASEEFYDNEARRIRAEIEDEDRDEED